MASKLNIFKLMKYGAAAIDVVSESALAISDGRLTTEEALKIVKTAIEGADIKGVKADLIEINSRPDGGFTVEFLGDAVKDWNIDFDMD